MNKAMIMVSTKTISAITVKAWLFQNSVKLLSRNETTPSAINNARPALSTTAINLRVPETLSACGCGNVGGADITGGIDSIMLSIQYKPKALTRQKLKR